jgi:rod shape-determining protein MreC
MEMFSRHAGSVAILVGLLFGFFILMSYQVNRAETVSAVEGTVHTLVSPAHRGASAVWLTLTGTWQRYMGLVGASSQSTRMRERNAVLERENSALQEAARENARLRQLLGLKERIESPSLAGEIIGREISHGYQGLTVNRGSWDGAEMDSPVVGPNGALVGRVVDVTGASSMVQALTDPESAVGAKVVRSDARGVVHGVGGPTLELAYVNSLEDVKNGDLVVTSGDDGLYPAGIPIGRVSRVAQGPPVPGSPPVALARGEGALFLEISLNPLVEVRRVDYVLLLRPLTHAE